MWGTIEIGVSSTDTFLVAYEPRNCFHVMQTHMLNRCIKILWPTLKVAIIKQVKVQAKAQLNKLWGKVMTYLHLMMTRLLTVNFRL